jgi:hypothetical protein
MTDYYSVIIGRGKRVHVARSLGPSDTWTLCGIGGVAWGAKQFTGEITDDHCKTCAAAWKQNQDAKEEGK